MEIRKGTDHTNEIIHQMLQTYNAQFMGEMKDYSYSIEEKERIAAGIVASSVFDTVEIDDLCVAEAYRNRGYGERLLQKVEGEARADQKKRILLNTYSFQAPAFYEKMGYRQLFKIAPALQEYAQCFYRKEL